MKKYYWHSAVTSVIVLTGVFGLSNSTVEAQGNSDIEQNSNGISQQRQLLALNQNQDSFKLEIIKDFTNYVILPTYEQLAVKAEQLSQTIDNFVANPNLDTLKNAQNTWIETRIPWEQGESFAFGPADSLGYDGDLDDWPVNEVDVQGVISNKQKLTLNDINNLQTTQKGFHTIELLLFGTNKNKQVQDFTPQELAYLQLLAQAFENTSQELLNSWSKGVQGYPPYKDILSTAGNLDNPAYPTIQAAFEEIAQGIIGCLDEVGNDKIGIPLEAQTTDELESRFSHTSLNDFKNNLISVKNAYLGTLSDNSHSESVQSLSLWVASQNPSLDKRVKSEIENAIASLDAIPAPIETNINNPKVLKQMEEAKKSVLQLFQTMEKDVLPLIQNS
ncbi:imelysin family protein [Cyanobacterium sp. DS4]|uniref:imelysin family protein n=1 Tax=Cyanobacterium sp. DS4 TaxID=2878255 RepID=UPI002E803D8D|nr:imelysin family protein [Cyanobacterium sp. Dongsha4]WVL02156.1 hypothetical protein Dongsha4_08195 [Cyanobacterium sp. Dongsha4]